jgi:hypothetical protein
MNYPRRTKETTRHTCPECGKRLVGYESTSGNRYWRCYDSKCLGVRSVSGYGLKWDSAGMIREISTSPGGDRVWRVQSRTDPVAAHTVLFTHVDLSFTCTCPGWQQRLFCFHCDQIQHQYHLGVRRSEQRKRHSRRSATNRVNRLTKRGTRGQSTSASVQRKSAVPEVGGESGDIEVRASEESHQSVNVLGGEDVPRSKAPDLSGFRSQGCLHSVVGIVIIMLAGAGLLVTLA